MTSTAASAAAAAAAAVVVAAGEEQYARPDAPGSAFSAHGCRGVLGISVSRTPVEVDGSFVLLTELKRSLGDEGLL